MQTISDVATRWPLELESKPDGDRALQRILAWYQQRIIDRPPVRFTRHNAEFEAADTIWKSSWRSLQDKWFDVEYQFERFLTEFKDKKFLGETFPIFWPNLGPNVFASFYGCRLEFGEVTSWAYPVLDHYGATVTLDWHNEYLMKLDELTRYALERCAGKFLVGYTDLHPGLDWLAALRGTEQLCLDFQDHPDGIKPLVNACTSDFLQVFDHFNQPLQASKLPSVTWMGIPFFGSMHIPSCDFATMISPRQFREYALPALLEEVQHMTHNIFHVDGKGVARHLDAILELPGVQALQWVQGVGDDLPILQWVPLIRRIQAAGRSVVVDLDKSELEGFISAVKPEGIFLCVASENEEEEHAILGRVARW
jgi:hypothetical protein